MDRTTLSRAEFEALFDAFTGSAWRLEIQPAYDEREEREPRRRLAGEPYDLRWMADWCEPRGGFTGDRVEQFWGMGARWTAFNGVERSRAP